MATPPTYPPEMDMSCQAVHEALRDGGLDRPEVPAEVRVHAASCEVCTELVAEDALLGRLLVDGLEPSVDTEALRQAVGARVRTEGGGARAWSTPTRALVAAGGVALLAGLTRGSG